MSFSFYFLSSVVSSSSPCKPIICPKTKNSEEEIVENTEEGEETIEENTEEFDEKLDQLLSELSEDE